MSIADLSTHQNFLSAALRRVTQRMYDRAGGFEIDVAIQSGLQAGARRRLQISKMLVGTGPENDLTLLDDAAENEHLELEFQRSVFGLLVDVTAKGKGVSVGGVPLDPGGRVEAVKLPLDIKIGQSEIRFDRAAAKEETSGRWQFLERLAQFDPVILLASVVLFILILGYLTVALIPLAQRSYDFVVQEPAGLAARYVGYDDERDWRKELIAQSDALGLSSDLSFEVTAEGLVSVSGNVPRAKIESMLELQNWYDGQPKAPAIVWDINRQSQLRNMPRVAMIRISNPAEVILNSGLAAQVGDELVDKWVVAEINETSLVLTRGTEKTVILHAELVK